jgi:hypothetical protein
VKKVVQDFEVEETGCMICVKGDVVCAKLLRGLRKDSTQKGCVKKDSTEKVVA